MAKALVTSRKYTNLFRAETTPYLTGNVGDVIDLELKLDVEITTTSSFSNPYEITSLTGTDPTAEQTIVRGTGSFFEEGFVEGQVVTIFWTLEIDTPATSTVYAYQGTINTLSHTIMQLDNVQTLGAVPPEYDATLIAPVAVYPFQETSGGATLTNSGLTIFSSTSVEGLEFTYGLTTNSQAQAATTASLIDGTTTIFKNSGISSANPSAVDLVPYGERSGMGILEATVKGLGSVGEVHSFQIDVKFLITPFYETILNIQNKALPSFYFDQECLTDVFKIKLQPQSGNPNVFIETDSSETLMLGNTGFYEENYNGGFNNYSVNSFSMFNGGGLPISGVQTTGETNFTAVINQPLNTATSKYKFGFALSPDDDSIYSNNPYPAQENFLYNGLDDSSAFDQSATPTTYTGFENNDGARMDIQLSSVTAVGDDVTIKGKFKPNAAFETYIASLPTADQNYFVWVSVADESLATNVSDRVSLLVDVSQFTIEEPASQPFDVTNSFLDHPQPTSQVGATVLNGCSEDEVLARSIIKLDTAKDETVEEITFSIEGFNPVTLERYTLEEVTYDTTGFVKDLAGIQQIDIDEKRGFLMVNGVDKDFVKVFRSPIDDSGTSVGFRALYAFRLRWEDWQMNSNVPSSFYDNTQLNNNFNNNWANKDDLANWILTYNVKMKVNSAGTIINTRNFFEFTQKTYDESTVWDGIISTWDETKTTNYFQGVVNGLRNNIILGTENTLVEAEFDLENLLADVGALSGYYGVIRIEEYQNGGLFRIHMLSSVLTNVTGSNLLKPLTGETGAKLTKVSATKITVEGLIDFTQLNLTQSQYKISARLGCADINAGKYSSHYSLKYN